MAQVKKKVPYRIRFRGAEYVRADVDIQQVRVPDALKQYISKRFKPLQTALDESQGLASSLARSVDIATMRKTGIRDITDAKEEMLLDQNEIWERIATFNTELANAVGKVEVLHKYLNAAADIAMQYDLLDAKLFNANVEKAKGIVKDLRPVAPTKELDKAFRELVNLDDARERLKKMDEEEEG